MIAWKEVPRSLWIYVALTIAPAIVQVATASVPIGPFALLVVVILVWNLFLLRGLRWLWLATVVLLVITFAIDLVTADPTWYWSLIGLIQIGLLVLPSTRRFYSSAAAAA